MPVKEHPPFGSFMIAVPPITVGPNDEFNPVRTIIKPLGTHLDKIDVVTSGSGRSFSRFIAPRGQVVPVIGWYWNVGLFPITNYRYYLDIDLDSADQEIVWEAYNATGTGLLYAYLLVSNMSDRAVRREMLAEYQAVRKLLEEKYAT